MPSLTSLSLRSGTCSDEAWRALGEAMGLEGTCLRRLQTLKFFSFTGARQVEILCRALGSGHGCPELEVIKISSGRGHEGEPCGAALAPAFRPPHGLPRLKELHLSRMNLTDLDQLVEALQHRPHASQPVETIRLRSCKLEDAAVIGQALATGRWLACLRDLTIESSQTQVEWPMQLVEALAGGAGQQLEDIECKGDGMTIGVVNRLLQGLAVRGACPRLQSLLLGRAFGGVVQGGQLDACSLGTILAGRAACSATLRKLTLDGLSLSNEGARTLAACLREPQAIQLEALELCAVEPYACEAMMELLSALGGRAGDRLQNVEVYLSRCERGEAIPVVEHVVGVMKAGGLSALKFCEIYIQETWESMGGKAVQQALRERAQAQWLASW